MVANANTRSLTMNSYAVLGNALGRRTSAASVRRRAQIDAFADLGPVVYYVWRKDHIKIGYTTDLRTRLSQLSVKRTAILAIESGTIQLESARHRRFERSLVEREDLGVEHYWPSAPLLAHINELRANHGLRPLRLGLRLAA